MTGSTGFLGGWLAKGLVERGANVVALIRDGSPQCMLVREGWLDQITTVRGDVQDLALVRRTLCEYSVDTAFHLAAQALVGVAKLDPLDTFEINVRGTWNLLEAARQAQVRQIVVASSDKAYGPSDQLPYEEQHPLQGVFPYDVSKSCVDLICKTYATTYETPVVVARCANLFGGGDLNYSRTLPGLIQSVFRGERFVIRSDGQYVRDFLYVKDAVEAYLCLAEKLAADRSLAGQAFNFSLEVRVTVLELVRKVLAMMGRSDLEPVIQNKASAEIREQYMVARKARQVLGWSPHYSLEEGLRETIEWYRSFGDPAAEPRLVSPASKAASV